MLKLDANVAVLLSFVYTTLYEHFMSIYGLLSRWSCCGLVKLLIYFSIYLLCIDGVMETIFRPRYRSFSGYTHILEKIFRYC